MTSNAERQMRGKFRDIPRSPRVEGDIVRKRKAQVTLADHLKRDEVTWKRKACPGSVVIHSAFTITPELDQMIHDAAIERNCSRSAVVRQALLHYFSR